MNSIAELVSAYQADKLKLPALFEALAERGAVPEAQYAAEVEWLGQQRAEGSLDSIVAKALLAKMAVLQAPPDDDATMVKPASRPPVAAPPVAADDADDATRVQPVARPVPPPVVDDEATIVKPTSRPLPPAVDDEVTVVKPASGRLPPEGHMPAGGTQQGFTGTGTGTSSSLGSQSSWQRIADAEGGDFVTVGSLLKGRFYLEREIGRGGMGVVYLARDERKVEARDRDPYVAVKVLNDEFRRHPDSLISLQRESRRSQQLAHDNIVRVFDFDKDRTIVFMTMEYIDGSDLKQLIRERAYNGMPLSQARPYIEGMAKALSRAHAAGVVHSDFKPANVMITREGVPKVFDFGIARAGKHMGDAVGDQTVFDAGTLGAMTPAYASLEMIQGKDPVPADDIYALGCVVFELLTGKHPYDKASAEVAMKEGRKPPHVKGLTKRQYRTLCASVAFTGEQRLKSANDLIDGLREISLGERMKPVLLYGLPAALAVAGGTWAWLNYQHSHHVTEVIARFGLARADHYTSETQALQALESLSEDERKRIVIDQGDLIQSFLLSRIDAYWNPAESRYDYAGAQRVFKLRDDLKLYSPDLDIRLATIEKQKNDRLNELDTQLSRQIDADAIFENQPDNVVATLASIRAIDPGSTLLDNTELELKYDAAIGKSLDDERVDDAAGELKLASSLFPDSSRLKRRAEELDVLGRALAAQQQQEQQARELQQQREQKMQALTGLLDNVSDTGGWRTEVTTAYRDAATLLGDEELAGQTARLKSLLSAQADRQRDDGNLDAAIDIAGVGVELFPDDSALSSAREQLLEQRNAQAQQAATEAQRDALAKSRIDDLLARPAGTAVWLQDIESALENARAELGGSSTDFAEVQGKANAGLAKVARERIAAGDLDAAERIADTARELDPSEAVFAAVLAEVADARAVEQQKIQQQKAQEIVDARAALLEFAAKPSLTADWQHSVATAMETLQGDNSPETTHAVDTLGTAIANEAARLAGEQHLPQAEGAVDFGLKHMPESASLIAQSAKLDALQKELQAKADQESALAEAKSRIESMKRAVAAGDVDKASQSLARVKALQPDNPFLKREGPKLLADAYLGAAQDTFERGRFQQAADVLTKGLGTLDGNADLRSARARYELVASIMAAGGKPLAGDVYAKLQKQLADIRRSDAVALDQIEADMRTRGQLTSKTLAEQLERLKPTGAPTTPAGTATGQRSDAGQAGTQAPSKPAPTASSGSGACEKAGLAGSGKFCRDKLLDGGQGPFMVVVPGVGGGRAYAMSRAEISINEFNQFCRATGKCAAISVGDPELGAAPVSNITFDQAQAYGRWLGDLSGFTYRLPTDEEWLHAAKAGNWKQAEDSNCIPPTAGGSDGGAAVSARGRSHNPWGLVNATGNVWEWVFNGGSVMVRGGSFNSYWSDCNVDTSRSDSGSPQQDVGFRILRELK